MKAVFIALLVGGVGCACVQPASAKEASNVTETVVHSFGSGTDGSYPNARLINVGGTFYGTTFYGGAARDGTVFSLNPKTGAEKVIYSFCSQQSCTDGQLPKAGLIDENGVLYSTTSEGGTADNGTVFALDLKTGEESVLYSFCSVQNCTDGRLPYAGLIDMKGKLYGTTNVGGANGDGTVFALDLKTDTEKTIYSFSGGDGLNPFANLVEKHGTLYSTTGDGGNSEYCLSSYGCGTVFGLDPKTEQQTMIFSFCNQRNCTDGESPQAGLIDVNGTFYGTTLYGGTAGDGAVFSLNPKTGAEKVIYSFCGQNNCPDGAYPYSSLINVDGTLYGTTSGGGASEDGTVFALDPKTGTETVLYSFCSQDNCADGFDPFATLIYVRGTLYGTTLMGGLYGYGTVFAVNP